MSTRYVWEKYSIYGSATSKLVNKIAGNVTTEFTEGTIAGVCSSDIEYVNDANNVWTHVKPKGNTKVLYRHPNPNDDIIPCSSYRYFFPVSTESGQSKIWANSGGASLQYWFFSRGGEISNNWACVINTAEVNVAGFQLTEHMVSFNQQGIEYLKYDLISKISSGKSNEYPTVSGGAISDGYWYTYKGSDNIDPTAVSYSAFPQAGKPVDVKVAPRSNTYGGTIYYQYQYSTNGGTTWTDAGAKTTDITKSITIPSGAAQFRARVLASDDMGFTSTTYVTGANVSLNAAPTAPASVTVPSIVAPGQEFTVSWTASTDPDGNLSGYQVERSYDGGKTWTSVNSAVTDTSASTTVAAGNTAVLFRVRAYDSGGLYSGWTISDSARINQPPSAPTELTIGAVTYGDYAELTWTAATDPDGSITGYTLQRSVNGGEFETVYTGTSLTYTDQAENWNWTTVQYRVQAEDNMGGLSEWTVSAQRQVQPGTLTLSGSPVDLGRVVQSFDFAVTISASGMFPVSGILVVITLDGEERLRTTVSSGGEATLNIDLWGLNSGDHTITVTASRDKFTTATGQYHFTVVPIELGEGGRLERLENSEGKPVYPITLTEGIFRKQDGKTLEDILGELDGGGSGEGTDLTFQATAETLPAGSQATVTVTQTGTVVNFHFGIPEGAQGKQGDVGPAGADGKDGQNGADGSPGVTMEEVNAAIQEAIGPIVTALSEV